MVQNPSRDAFWSRLRLATDLVIDEVLEPITAARDRAAIGSQEAQRAVGFVHDAEPAFMQLLVVMRAERVTFPAVVSPPSIQCFI